MGQRTCEIAGCDKAHVAKGLCSSHYSEQRRAWLKTQGRSHHTYVERACQTCGKRWETSRPEARFCTAKCKGVFLSELKRTKCALPKDHPVTILIAKARTANRRSKPKPFAWRTARECPGCACWFTPLWTPTTITCSKRCSKKMSRQRRRAREADAPGTYTWSEFMRIARKFNYTCAYCGERPDRLDPDHVVPLSRGGSNSPSNILPCCLMCNASKNAMTLHEWERWLADRAMPARATKWDAGDQRYTHLADAVLTAA